MKPKALIMAVLAALCCTACITVNNNIGDSAIKAVSGKAELAATNSVASANATNTVDASGSQRLKGGIVVSTTVNKNVSPVTSTALQYMP